MFPYCHERDSPTMANKNGRNEMRYLFTIASRGTYYKEFMNHADGPQGIVLMPALQAEHAVRLGDRLELRRPDGRKITTSVHGFFTDVLQQSHIRLNDEFSLDEVPRGTEVWVADKGDLL
jgi:hypothetical protein